MRLFSFLKIVGILTLLSACQTTSTLIGEGPIQDTSAHFQEAWEKYQKYHEKNKSGTTAFAFSRSKGKSGGSYAYGNDAYGRALREAVSQCGASDCKIYAVNGTVVWKNKVTPVSTVKIGSGQIELTSEAQQVYQTYLDRRPVEQNSVFAIAPDSKSARYVWFKDLEKAKSEAILGCNESSASKGNPQNCGIYDINGEIVWNSEGAIVKTDGGENTNSQIERLRLLDKSLKEGLISEEEAKKKREEILNEI